MKLLLMAALTLVAISASAAECRDPEYSQLSMASKKELQTEYCRAQLNYELKMKFHEIAQDAVKQKADAGLDASQSMKDSLVDLRGANQCSHISWAYSDAMFRRFKSRPAKPCK